MPCKKNCRRSAAQKQGMERRLSVKSGKGWDVGWLVGFGFNGPLRQYFSLYRAVSKRAGEKG